MSKQETMVVTYLSTVSKDSGVYSIHHCEKHHKEFPVGTPIQDLLDYEKELSAKTPDFDWVMWGINSDVDLIAQNART